MKNKFNIPLVDINKDTEYYDNCVEVFDLHNLVFFDRYIDIGRIGIQFGISLKKKIKK